MLEYILSNSAPLLQGTLLGSVLGFFLSKYIEHLLSKSRAKENFNRQSNREDNKEIQVTLNELGSFMNGILRCWEESSFNASHAQNLSESQLRRVYRRVAFDEYSDYKKILVPKGVFPPNAWDSFDKLPDKINEANKMVSNYHMAPVSLAHFANFCECLWNLSAKAYKDLGGDLNHLTRPMPANYERYGG